MACVYCAGLELLGFGGNTDMDEAAALSHAKDIIDVYSNSWGPPDIGYNVEGPGTLTKYVLQEGVTKVINQQVMREGRPGFLCI